MLHCPVCESKVKVIGVRPTKYYLTNRTYECIDCHARFKTREKLVFESVPYEVRKRFLETGRKK